MENRVRPTICVAKAQPYERFETFVRDHVERLPADVCVVSGPDLSESPTGDAPGPWRPVRSIAFRLQRRRGRDYPGLLRTRALSRYLVRHAVDVVLAEFGATGVKFTDACERTGVPLVVHFHGYDAYRASTLERLRDGYARMFERCAAIVAVSHDMERQLVELGAPAGKVRYNPYGVDCALLPEADPAGAAPLFVGVGRFVKKKAPHLTLEAFRSVLNACPEARLLLIGDGPLLPACRAMVEALGMEDSVELPGRLPHPEVVAHLVRARAFVQHSVRAPDGDCEGMPVAILEAGGAGLPVVSTRHMGITEAVVEGETGLLVDERDLAGMAEQMTALAVDPDLAGRMGRAARERISAEFSAAKSIAGLWRILQEVAPAARSARAAAAGPPPLSRPESGYRPGRAESALGRLAARLRSMGLPVLPGWRKHVMQLLHLGGARFCPVCGSHVRRFLPHGVHARPEARCPICGAMERHRAMWGFLQDATDLLDGRRKRVLHFAPERGISEHLERAPGLDYVTADIASPHTTLRLDVTDIDLPDASFDVVLCSHVLEHVPEDRRALREILRVLKPAGWAVIQVPVFGETTVEAPAGSTVQDRVRLFGHGDHVRSYGTDFRDRLREAGFALEVHRVGEQLDKSERRRMGLARHLDVNVCRGPIAPPPEPAPLVSVVLPVWNAACYLEEAVRSVLDQPCDAEVILVEDGSTDGSLEVCRRLTTDRRVRLLRHPGGANRGAGASRNAGIRNARGRYVAFLDADDYYLPNRFADDIPMLEADPRLDGVYAAARTKFEPGYVPMPAGDLEVTTVREQVPPEDLLELLLMGGRGWFCTLGITVRREFFGRTGLFDEDLALAQDTAMWLKMAAAGRLAAGSIETPVAVRRRHAGNRSSTGNPHWREARCACGWSVLRWARRTGQPRQTVALLVRGLALSIVGPREGTAPLGRALRILRRTLRYGSDCPALLAELTAIALRKLSGRPVVGAEGTGR